MEIGGNYALDVFGSLGTLDLNTDDKVFTLYIKREVRQEPNYKEKKEFPVFTSPIVGKKTSRASATNTEVAVSLRAIGIDIFATPLEAEFKDPDEDFKRQLLLYLVASLNIKKNPSFTQKQRLANRILGLIINYIALGKFGRNKADRYRGLLTGQLIESLRGNFSN